jgi:hypothetical protein
VATLDRLLDWALDHASELEADMKWVTGSSGTGGWWTAVEPELTPVIRARATSALAFLQTYAGPDSQWYIGAQRVFDSQGDHKSMESGARGIADVLRAWVAQVRDGITVPRLVEAQGARAIASTDLMEQVRALIEDRGVHPAAPMVLAGAALETALRSAVDELGLELVGSPSIMVYARCLRTDGILSKQDMKDLEQMAGLRNAAAHGDFDQLSPERAGLLEQQVNVFLRRLAELLEPRASGALAE